MNKGMLYGAGAYLLWGLLPIFWKSLHTVPALEILAHRMVWSLAFVVVLLAVQGHWRWLGPVFKNGRVLLTFAISALLLSLNWFLYIWSVNAGYIVETSLGYFINPLVNVLLGTLFLKERLRLWQAAAIIVAVIGVLYLTLHYGSLPWIALTLAGSFGVYGLLRKTASLNSLEGLTLETLLLFPPALAYLIYREWTGSAAFGHTGLPTMLLLICAGVATALPLLLFASGARRVTLTLMGILQYIAPTMQFLIGVFLYNESLTRARLIGFSLIWLALAIYSLEGIFRSGRATRLRAVAHKP